MVKLIPVEATDERLCFRMGALAMMGQMAIVIFVSICLSISLILFLDNVMGEIAYILFGVPGLTCVVCGFIGCGNARMTTFIFDRTRGEFIAMAGNGQLVRPFSSIRLVHIERETSSTSAGGGSSLMGGPNTYALALLFDDSTRFRLEGGVSISGSEMTAPEPLPTQAEQVRAFLRLPQERVSFLDITRALKERRSDDQQAHAWLSRWMACRALEPTLEEPLCQYDWIDPPVGAFLPAPIPRPSGMLGPSSGHGVATGMGRGGPPGVLYGAHYPQGQAFYNRAAQGATPVVLGRAMPVTQPRLLQFVVSAGQQGQTLRVATPEGLEVEVPVPADAVTGQALTVQY